MLTPETATNWASVEHGVRLVDFSSQVEECDADHVLDNSLNTIWLTKEGLPQWLCFSLLDATQLQELQIKTVGWHCWHSYTTNPKSVTLHVSSDGSKFRRWDNFTAHASSDQVQLFNCAPISPKVYPYIAFEINSTFGGEQTYLNRVYLFTDEVSHPTASQATPRSPSSTLDTESLVHVLDQAMHATEESAIATEDGRISEFPEYRHSRGFGSSILHTPAITADNTHVQCTASNHVSPGAPTPATVEHSSLSNSSEAMLRILKLENRIDELMVELRQLKSAASSNDDLEDKVVSKIQQNIELRQSCKSEASSGSRVENTTPSRIVRNAATSTDSVVSDMDVNTNAVLNGSAASTIETLTQSVRHLESLVRSTNDAPPPHPIISDEPHLPPFLSRRNRGVPCSDPVYISKVSSKGPGGIVRPCTDLSLHPQATSLKSESNLTPASIAVASRFVSRSVDDDVYRITAKLHDKILQRTIKEAQLRVIRENKAKRRNNI